MMEILTLEWRCFIEAARQRNISQAADRLHLPQPSVTKYLKRLESNLGLALFQRSNRGVKLTETGERLFERITGMTDKFRDAVRAEAHVRNEVVGTVSFGTHRVIGMGILPEKLASLYAAHPELKIEIQLGTSTEISRLVASGILQYGLVANPIRLPGLVIVKVGEEGVALYSCGESEIKKKLRVFYNPEMQRLPLALRKIPDAQLEAVSDYELLGKLASQIPGSAALVPERVAHRYGLRNRLTPILYRATIGLIFQASMERSARHRAIISGISDTRLRMGAVTFAK